MAQGQIITRSNSWTKSADVIVSRNVAGMFTSMLMLQIRFIVVVLLQLRQRYYVKDFNKLKELGEVEVEVPASLISSMKDIPTVISTLRPLLDMVVVYRYCIPGVECKGLTTLISTVEYRNRQYFARIPNASLLWYMYYGQGVGFLQAEPKVVFAIQSSQQIRLYFALLAFVDATSQMGKTTLTMDKIREVIGVTPVATYSRVRSRVIDPLITILDACKSKIIVSFEPHTIRAGKKGHPSIDGGVFTMKPRVPHFQQDEYHCVLQTISRYYSYFSPPSSHQTRIRVDIVNDIIESGEAQRFLSVITLDEERCVKKYNEKQRPYAMASRLCKILREDFNIAVFSQRS